MKILITGAHGFVGKNLCAALYNIADGKDKSHSIDNDITVFEYDIDTDFKFYTGKWNINTMTKEDVIKSAISYFDSLIDEFRSLI